MKVLLGVTGSVAAKLTRKIVDQLLVAGHEVQIAATEASFYFWSEEGFSPEIKEQVKVWRDKDEWVGVKYDPDIPITHIELSKWADVFLIAPITANSLFEIAYGGAENVVTCTARAWWNYEDPGNQKPLIIAPAMNSRMWFHPTTAEQINRISGWYGDKFKMVPPVSRRLACGDTGIGALADIDKIVAALEEYRDASVEKNYGVSKEVKK